MVTTLTLWGRVTHICVGDLTSIGSDNGLSPGRRQSIIRTNAGILLIRPFGTNFSEIIIEILIFSFRKKRLKVSSAKRRPFCLGLNELTNRSFWTWLVVKKKKSDGLIHQVRVSDIYVAWNVSYRRPWRCLDTRRRLALLMHSIQLIWPWMIWSTFFLSFAAPTCVTVQ